MKEYYTGPNGETSNPSIGDVVCYTTSAWDWINSLSLAKTKVAQNAKTFLSRRRIVFNGPATILFTTDSYGNETKTIVKSTVNDEFNPKYGFLLAYFQQTSGLSKTQANKVLDEVAAMAEEQAEKNKKKEKKNDD